MSIPKISRRFAKLSRKTLVKFRQRFPVWLGDAKSVPLGAAQPPVVNQLIETQLIGNPVGLAETRTGNSPANSLDVRTTGFVDFKI